MTSSSDNSSSVPPRNGGLRETANAKHRAGPSRLHYCLKLLIRITSLVWLPRVMKSCLPSRDQAKSVIRSEVKFVIWWGGSAGQGLLPDVGGAVSDQNVLKGFPDGAQARPCVPRGTWLTKCNAAARRLERRDFRVGTGVPSW